MTEKLSLDCYAGNEKGIHPTSFPICTRKSATIGGLKLAISESWNKDINNLVCIIISKIPKDTDLLANYFELQLWPIYVYVSKNALFPNKTYGEQISKEFLVALQMKYNGAELTGLNEKPSVNNSQLNKKGQPSTKQIKKQSDNDDEEEDDKEEQKNRQKNLSGDKNDRKPSEKQHEKKDSPTKTPAASSSFSSIQNKPKNDEKSKSDDIQPRPGEWECIECTMINNDSTLSCSMCLTERPINNRIADNNKLPIKLNDEIENLLNSEEFECEICSDMVPPGHGIILSSCTHQFCKQCFTGYLIDCPPHEMFKCPFNKKSETNQSACEGSIVHNEAKAMLTKEQFKMYTNKENKFNLLLVFSNEKCINCHSKGKYIVRNDEFVCSICNSIYCMECREIRQKNVKHNCRNRY